MSTEGELEFCAALADAAAAQMGWRPASLLGSGVEFAFFAIEDGRGNRRGLRVPRCKVYRTANDLGVTAEAVQRQELHLARWAADHGLPVPAAETIVEVDGYPLLLVDIHDDDGSPVSSVAVGRLLAALHAAPLPQEPLVAQRGRPATQLVPLRLVQRHTALRGFVGELHDLPGEEWLGAALTRARPRLAVNHLDIRRQNILTVGGNPTALIDWTNSLIADPLMELARAVEYADMPENGLDAGQLLAGYGREVDTECPSWIIYGLDAAVMLAVMFATVLPNPERVEMYVNRIHELLERL